MANGIKSIYSRRQRMAPGQYETPLADFLDKLPDYISGYQQQKLQEKKYDDALARQTRLDKRQIELDKRNEKRYQEGIIRDENELKRNTADGFVKQGRFDQAISIYEYLGDDVSANAARESKVKTEGMNDSFVDLRNDFNEIPENSTDIFLFKDRLNNFENEYPMEASSKIYSEYMRMKDKVGVSIKRMNKGMIPIGEWQNMDAQGVLDHKAAINSAESIKDLSETARKAHNADTRNQALERLELAKKTYQEILTNPRYKLETEEQYRQSIIDAEQKRINAAKLQSDAAIKEKRNQEFLAKRLEADRLGLTMPNITEGSSFEGVGAPTPEEMVAFEENISKQLDGMTSDIDNEDTTVKPFNIPGLNTLQADPVKPQSTTQKTDSTGQKISTQDPVEYDIKEISKISGRAGNPLYSSRLLSGDFKKIHSATEELNNLSKEKIADSTKVKEQKRLNKFINQSKKKIKQYLGEYITKDKASFSNAMYEDRFYRNLSIDTGLEESVLRDILKELSMAKEKKSKPILASR